MSDKTINYFMHLICHYCTYAPTNRSPEGDVLSPYRFRIQPPYCYIKVKVSVFSTVELSKHVFEYENESFLELVKCL